VYASQGVKKVHLSTLVAYYPGNIAPNLRPHEHAFRVISRGRDGDRRIAVTGCAFCGKTEVVEVTA